MAPGLEEKVKYGCKCRTALRMLVIHTKHRGFFVALVPAALSPEQLDAALDEFGIDAAAVLELGDWRTSADNVTVAFVPPLELN